MKKLLFLVAIFFVADLPAMESSGPKVYDLKLSVYGNSRPEVLRSFNDPRWFEVNKERSKIIRRHFSPTEIGAYEKFFTDKDTPIVQLQFIYKQPGFKRLSEDERKEVPHFYPVDLLIGEKKQVDGNGELELDSLDGKMQIKISGFTEQILKEIETKKALNDKHLQQPSEEPVVDTTQPSGNDLPALPEKYPNISDQKTPNNLKILQTLYDNKKAFVFIGTALLIGVTLLWKNFIYPNAHSR
jgi:hypothetical protein